MLGNEFVIIDPLFEHLRLLIQSGEKKCLEKSIALYGSERDMDRLQQLISRISATKKKKQLLVDLSPIPSLGAQKRFLSLLELNKKIPFIIAIRSSMALEQFKYLKDISVLLIDDNSGIIIESHFNGKNKKKLNLIYSEHFKGKTIVEVRKTYFHEYLLQLSKDFVKDPPAGSRYIQLHDKAWANKWIDVKAILRSSRTSLLLAYQMCYALTDGFANELSEDIFLVGNNTAYLLAILINKIFEEKQLTIIDRLGPFPKFSSTRADSFYQLKKKKVCIIEDVVATGREVDLLALLALVQDAEINRAVCVFDLECASSKFIDSDKIISLCKPSCELDYERIPKYIGEMNHDRL